MMTRRLSALVTAVLLLSPLPAAAQQWKVDHEASRLGFEATQLGSSFEGEFTSWSADIVFDPDALDTSHARVVVDLSSADTGSSDRDGQLVDADWFDVASHPQAVFVTTAFRRIDDGRYEADGTLTLKGTSQPVTLPFDLAVDGDAAQVSGRLPLARLDFGVGSGEWANESTVGNGVDVIVELTATRS